MGTNVYKAPSGTKITKVFFNGDNSVTIEYEGANIRPRSQESGCYWTARSTEEGFSPVSFRDRYDRYSDTIYNSGNYFLIVSDCQRLCDKLNDVVKNFE